ncbi:MAG: hypothetical protein QOI01_1992 [Mycobacterium sp.]|jgi:hypothetical protein|nr:hypothetical protein [Mycobacterium sp.]
MKSVIHDWPDHRATAILRSARAAPDSDAPVLLVETVLPEHHREFPEDWADLEMLLVAGSRERTAAEYGTYWLRPDCG